MYIMKRQWYPDDFDKKTGVKERDRAIIDLWNVTQKYQEKKKKMKINALELLLWWILLFFCVQYLQQHPAEKIALISWFEVITQKVRVFFTDNSQDLQAKYDLERSFSEVISLAKEWDCLPENDIQEIENRLTSLQSMDVDTYESQKSAFMNYLRLQYLTVKEACENNT